MSNSRYPGVPRGLSRRQAALKRAFDLSVSVPGMILTFPITLAAVVLATFDTREFGIFSQVRIGSEGKPFTIHKIRSMKSSKTLTTTVTSSSDPRITRLGSILRRTKVDELIQLWDVALGRMSIVGPRPDVPGWADELVGDDRIVLSVRPGITGPAALYFRNEEQLLSTVPNKEKFNREVVWPKKVELNANYVREWSLFSDLAIIARTLFPRLADGAELN
ncbi:sugar transferase [Dietzia sp. B19]|nr:sugar transferase [Dietzia sp. B19]